MIHGTLIKRYKRFLADVWINEGKEQVLAHVPNTGSMKGLCDEGMPVLLSYDGNPKRKIPHTLEAVCVQGTWVGCNTRVPNQLVEEAVLKGQIEGLTGYKTVKREVNYGENSRIDLFLSDHVDGKPNAYVEVKNVTLREGDEAQFPDAVTVRGKKHLEELQNQVKKGFRSVMVFLIQRDDCARFAPARGIDPAYADELQKAHKNGVEIICKVARVSPEETAIIHDLPWVL